MLICQRDFIDGEVERGIGLSPCPGLALGVSDCAVGEISHAVRRSRCGDGLPLGSPGALWPSRWIVRRSTGRRPE
jgi:hypothetical protein